MDLAGAASLIVATFELSVVRGVIDAIRTADIHSGRQLAASGLGPAPNPDVSPRLQVRAGDVYEASDDGRRNVSGCYAPRYGNRAAPQAFGYLSGTVRYVAAREPQYNSAACGWECTDAVKPACPNEGPIPPVWKQLPPLPPRGLARAQRVVKVVRQQPDIHHRGAIVDIHI